MSQPFHSSNAFMEGVASQSPTFPKVEGVAAKAALAAKTRFGYLFDYEPGERLDPGEKTVFFLMELGASMGEKFIDDSTIPSAYTYFGQFIAHDLTFDPVTKEQPLFDKVKPLVVPLNPEVVNALPNLRSGLLDLDCVYGPGFNKTGSFEVPLTGNTNEEMKLGVAYRVPIAVAGTDVPRDPHEPFDALIGDERNDENVPLSQLHLAFLKAHNRLVTKSNLSFKDAQDLLKRRYQNLVVKDFLPRIVDSQDIDKAKAKLGTEQNPYSPKDGDFFIPIEFSGAAFRFGHSMIRSEYVFNTTHRKASLLELFTRAAMAEYTSLLAQWVIDWSNFIDTGKNKARTFSPQLVEPLGAILNTTHDLRFSLAVNDLLRGYRFGLPTGQALAKRLGVEPLKPSEVIENSIGDKQKEILHDSGFDKATPLWFYLFVEARKEQQGQLLGPCCGQLIALVLLELARRSNYQDDDPWNETLGKKDTFDLSEFIKHTLL